MIRGPRLSALVASAALALAAGCAGAPARPVSALAPELRELAAPPEAGSPDVSAARAPSAPGSSGAPASSAAAVRAPEVSSDPDVSHSLAHVRAREVSSDARVSPSPPASGGGRGRERGAIVPAAEPPTGEPGTGVRAQVIDAARRMLGTRTRLDCSGFVLAALSEAGVSVALPPARSRSESLFLAGRPVAHPSPGDLVFFHRTHDRDRRGSRAERNRFTHVALVEAVDGTQLTLLHRGGKRVERIRMDLSRPSDPAANDPVRLKRKRDRPGTRYLSGELFAAFGGLLPDDVTRKLQARRGRDTSARHPASR